MISGIQQQDVNFGALAGGGQRRQVAYVPQGGADTVELSAKKAKVKKGILATLGTVLVAGAALFGLVKTGKLTKVENPTNFLGKMQNVAYGAGEKVVGLVDKCAETKVGQWCKEKGSSVVDWVKGLFGKKAE